MSFLASVQLWSGVGSIVAAVLALGAIVQSSRQAKRNAELIARERHRATQLDAVERLGEIVVTTSFNLTMVQQRVLAAQLPLAVIEGAVPVTRARFTRPFREVAEQLGLEGRDRLDSVAHLEENLETLPDARGVMLRDRMVGEIAAEIRALTSG